MLGLQHNSETNCDDDNDMMADPYLRADSPKYSYCNNIRKNNRNCRKAFLVTLGTLSGMMVLHVLLLTLTLAWCSTSNDRAAIATITTSSSIAINTTIPKDALLSSSSSPPSSSLSVTRIPKRVYNYNNDDQDNYNIDHQRNASGTCWTFTTTASRTSSILPTWQALLQNQEPQILTHLIHAALLLASAVYVFNNYNDVRHATAKTQSFSTSTLQLSAVVLWLWFQRNCALFWTMVSGLYATVDLVSLTVVPLGSSNNTNHEFYMVRSLLAVTFGLGSVWAWYVTERRLLQPLILQQQQQQQNLQLQNASSISSSSCRGCRILLHRVALILPLVTLAHYLTSIYHDWYVPLLQQQQQHIDDNDCRSSSSFDRTVPNVADAVVSFVATYSEQAHASFLLALVQLAATLPDAGEGAFVVSLTRLGILLTTTITTTYWKSHDEYSQSWLLLLEMGLYCAVLGASGWLWWYRDNLNHGTIHSNRAPQRLPRLQRSNPCSYSAAAQSVEDDPYDRDVTERTDASSSSWEELSCPDDHDIADEDDDDGDCRDDDGDCRDVVHDFDFEPVHIACTENEKPYSLRDDTCNQQTKSPMGVSTFPCTSLHTIAYSQRHKLHQQWGAWILSVGSQMLLLGMTAEIGLVLSQHAIGTAAVHELYQWGMHVCVLFFFIHSMCVDSPSVYRMARPLLLLACPTGTVVALWQWILLWRKMGETTTDVAAKITVGLLLARAFSGLVQTLGVLLLDHTEPQPCVDGLNRQPSDDEGVAVFLPAINHRTNLVNDDLPLRLETAQRAAHQALYRMFLPALAVYTVQSVAMQEHCFSTTATTTIVDLEDVDSDACVEHDSIFVLSYQWPGLGLFFHFGLVLLWFAHDGLRQTQPSYRPSLAIASLCAGHLAVLTLVDLLVWDAVQTNMWQYLARPTDCIQRLALLFWALASGYLGFSLHRLRKLRILPPR